MAVYARTSDVQIELMRSLTEAETTRMDWLLDLASRLVVRFAPDVDDRIADGSLDAEIVKMIVVHMVTRTLRRPEGVKSETIGPKSVVYDTTASEGLFLAPAEMALLAPPVPAGGARSRSIAMARPTWWV